MFSSKDKKAIKFLEKYIEKYKSEEKFSLLPLEAFMKRFFGEKSSQYQGLGYVNTHNRKQMIDYLNGCIDVIKSGYFLRSPLDSQTSENKPPSNKIIGYIISFIVGFVGLLWTLYEIYKEFYK